MSTHRARGWVAAVLSLAAGAIAAFSLPPFGFWPLALVGFAALFALLRRSSAGTRFLLGLCFGVGFFGVGYAWVAQLVVAGAVALVLFQAVLGGLAAVLAVPTRSSTTAAATARVLTFTSALVLVDDLRWQWPFGGLPTGSVALGQAASPLGQLARIGGPLVVEAAVFLAGAALAELAMALWSQPGTRRSPAAGISLAALAVLTALTAVATGIAPDGGTPVGSLRVAAVQGGGVRGLHAIFTDASVVFDRQWQLTGAISPRSRLGLVLWPEDVVALDQPLASSFQSAQIGAEAEGLHATLVAGVTVTVGATRFRNEEVAWAPDGSIIAAYEKVHRVPFGEYIPLRGFFAHLGPTSLVPRDAIPGHGPGILRTPAATLGVMISFEVFYPARAAAAVGAGATVLLVPTNDASYSTGQVPAQEVAADRLRAIEQGRDVVQAAPTGYTDFVDHRGRLLRRSSLGRQVVLYGTVGERRGRTWYFSVGDGPMVGLSLGVLALAWSLALRSRASGNRDEEIVATIAADEPVAAAR